MHNFLRKISVLFFRNPINLHVAKSKALAFPRQRSNPIYSALSHSSRLLYLIKFTQSMWERHKCVCLHISNNINSFFLPAELLKIFMRLFTLGPVCWKNSTSQAVYLNKDSLNSSAFYIYAFFPAKLKMKCTNEAGSWKYTMHTELKINWILILTEWIWKVC